MLDYFYTPTANKSPDMSFTPRDIQIPPALIPNTIKSGRVRTAYPTLILEYAHRNESLKTLKENARKKAFTAATTIRVLIGVKFFKSAFQAFWARRLAASGMNIVETTTKMDSFSPTLAGGHSYPCNRNILGCGPNYPLPPLASPTLTLSMDRMRHAIMNKI